MEVVRELHDGFMRIGITPIREALHGAADVGAAAETLGEFGELVLASVSPEVEIELRATSFSLPDMPAGTRMRGLEGWAAFWRAWLEPWEEFDFEVGNFADLGDHVLLDITASATGRGSGLPIEVTLSQIWTVRNGKVSQLIMFDTRKEALEAAGLSE